MDTGGQRKILVVDDERGYAEGVVKEYLEKHDYDVRVETEGARCLAAAKEFRPDLILLDVMMRDRAGPQVASEVRADEALKGVNSFAAARHRAPSVSTRTS